MTKDKKNLWRIYTLQPIVYTFSVREIKFGVTEIVCRCVDGTEKTVAKKNLLSVIKSNGIYVVTIVDKVASGSFIAEAKPVVHTRTGLLRVTDIKTKISGLYDSRYIDVHKNNKVYDIDKL